MTKATKIKFGCGEFPVNTSADAIPAPDPNTVLEDFNKVSDKVIGYFVNNYRSNINDARNAYNKLKERVCCLAAESKSLRQFMTKLVFLCVPEESIIFLEDLLAQNTDKARMLSEKYEISARAVCPDCNKFVRLSLRSGKTCCGVIADDVLKTGRYVMEGGYFPVLIRLCGYLPRIKNTRTSQYVEIARKALEDLAVGEPRISIYEPIDNPPMLELYLFGRLRDGNQ